jgi:hypothetical protein
MNCSGILFYFSEMLMGWNSSDGHDVLESREVL